MNNLVIDVLCNDGSPLGVHLSDIYGNMGRIGVGGAELALLTLCEAWGKSGHHVRLYNNPTRMEESPFEQLPIKLFRPHDDRDILIIFRSPNRRIDHAKGKKIWWSTDQYTVGDFKLFSEKVDKIVTISPYHAHYFQEVYGITNTHTIDLPVRLGDYGWPITKKPKSMLFCSVPDRGLYLLADIYPRVKESVPEASLTITSDYRLWGVGEPRNEHYITKFLGMDGVRFLGAVPRMEMVQAQKEAEIQSYPCTYEELFCYSVAECQVAGAVPITTQTGAIHSTNMAIQVAGDFNSLSWRKQYAAALSHYLKSDELPKIRETVQQTAKERFSLEAILPQWDKVFYD